MKRRVSKSAAARSARVPKTITIKVPVEDIERFSALLEISTPEMMAEFREQMQHMAKDFAEGWSNWTANWLFPDRTTAERVAGRLFKLNPTWHSVELDVEPDGEPVMFPNPTQGREAQAGVEIAR